MKVGHSVYRDTTFIPLETTQTSHDTPENGRDTVDVITSGDHQLRLVVDLPSFTRFLTSQVVVWDFFHQQYGIHRMLRLAENPMETTDPLTSRKRPQNRCFFHISSGRKW